MTSRDEAPPPPPFRPPHIPPAPFRVLSLCSGIGGLDLGIRMAVPGARTIGYVEGEAFAAAILVKQMEAGGLDPAPVFPDVRGFDARAWAGAVDCVVAGFPCQPASVAGKRLGTDDPRWLWPQVQRVIVECGAGFAFLENVPGLRTKGLDAVLEGLAAIGFDAEWTHLRASDVGAPHKRDRWFCLAAHPERTELRDEPWRRSWAGREGPAEPGFDGADGRVAHPDRWRQPQQPQRNGEQRQGQHGAHWNDAVRLREAVADARRAVLPQREGPQAERPHAAARGGGWWAAEPDVGRVADGVPNRVDRLRALGNGVVPQQAAEAFRILYHRLIG